MSVAKGRAGPEAGTRFPSPLRGDGTAECAGREVAVSHPTLLFAEDRRAFERCRFWFQDTVHYAEPHHPFDVDARFTVTGFSQASARLFVVPTSLGLRYT